VSAFALGNAWFAANAAIRQGEFDRQFENGKGNRGAGSAYAD